MTILVDANYCNRYMDPLNNFQTAKMDARMISAKLKINASYVRNLKLLLMDNCSRKIELNSIKNIYLTQNTTPKIQPSSLEFIE